MGVTRTEKNVKVARRFHAPTKEVETMNLLFHMEGLAETGGKGLRTFSPCRSAQAKETVPVSGVIKALTAINTTEPF